MLHNNNNNQEEIRIDDIELEEGEIPTTTKDSIHASVEAMWAKRKAEIEIEHTKVAHQKEKHLQKQLKKLNQQNQKQQQNNQQKQ